MFSMFSLCLKYCVLSPSQTRTPTPWRNLPKHFHLHWQSATHESDLHLRSPSNRQTGMSRSFSRIYSSYPAVLPEMHRLSIPSASYRHLLPPAINDPADSQSHPLPPVSASPPRLPFLPVRAQSNIPVRTHTLKSLH